MRIGFEERYRLLKELKIEIDENGILKGFIELVSIGKIPLQGKIRIINGAEVYKSGFFTTPEKTKESLKLLPLKLHFRTKKALSESDVIAGCPPDTDKTVNEFAKTIYDNLPINEQIRHAEIRVGARDGGVLIIWFVSKNANIELTMRLADIEILKSQNIQGLKDVQNT